MIYQNWSAAMSFLRGHSLWATRTTLTTGMVRVVAPRSRSEGATKRHCVIEAGGLSETVVFGRTLD
jgi:hypothetical protein